MNKILVKGAWMVVSKEDGLPTMSRLFLTRDEARKERLPEEKVVKVDVVLK